MKNYLLLFFIWASCTPEETPYLPVDQRETVETLDQELVEVWSRRYPENSDAGLLILKRINHPEKDSLTLADTLVMSQFVGEIGWWPEGLPFTGDIMQFFSNFHYGDKGLNVLVSGQIKAFDPRDSLPGLPFMLEKIVQTPPCPVVIPEKNLSYPLQNINWKWIGFIDDSGQVYSHPTCESPNGLLRFTENSQSSPGYINPQYPKAMKMEFSAGISSFYETPYLYETEGNTLSIYSTFWYGPNRHPVAFPITTKRAAEKRDSVRQVIAPGELDFLIQGNRLIISRKDTNLRLLYGAN